MRLYIFKDKIVYSPELGLAIEELPKTLILSDLWKIINISNH